MAVFRGPMSFTAGSPPGEPGRREQEMPVTAARIEYSFAVSVLEITMDQFLRFPKEAGFAWPKADKECPANLVSFDDATRYCRF